MRIVPLAIEGPLLIKPQRIDDERGYFFEAYRANWLDELDSPVQFIQDNQTYSTYRGTIRGLHCQRAPHPQAKLIRVLRGAVFDVAVDARPDSPSFGRHVVAKLSAENQRQFYIPAGFLHGFATLTDDTEILYKVSDYYDPACDTAVAWNDADLAIDWPVDANDAILSGRDRAAPGFRTVFGY